MNSIHESVRVIAERTGSSDLAPDADGRFALRLGDKVFGARCIDDRDVELSAIELTFDKPGRIDRDDPDALLALLGSHDAGEPRWVGTRIGLRADGESVTFCRRIMIAEHDADSLADQIVRFATDALAYDPRNPTTR